MSMHAVALRTPDAKIPFPGLCLTSKHQEKKKKGPTDASKKNFISFKEDRAV